jgi:hypothetical protein
MNPGLLTAFVAIPFNLRVPRPSLSSVCVNYNLRPILLRSPRSVRPDNIRNHGMCQLCIYLFQSQERLRFQPPLRV